jgi:uroporphyrinogen decarboxylase
MSKIFIDACLKKEIPYTPVWIMRQAGRYLPEYRELRSKAGSFLNLCHNPDLACEVTLQPLKRFDLDAAILFSDILVVPNEMGMELKFVTNEGPVFTNPIKTMDDIDRLESQNCATNLSYVYKTIEKIKKTISPDKALIGFCGSPWTLATYMIEGKGTKTYSLVKKLIYSDPDMMHALLRKTTEVTKEYLSKQIEAGADAVQIFDSWAAALESSKYFEFSWSYMKEIASFIKQKYPNTPVMLFPKGIAGYLEDIDGDFDVFGVDWSTPMKTAKNILSDRYTLQGNMEPCRLYSKEATKECVESIANTMKDRSHIFNLGHGILPDIDPENVKFFVDLVHKTTKR